MGLPNKINLFDWTKEDYINTEPSIETISRKIAGNINKDDNNSFRLEELLNSFYEWKKEDDRFRDKKIDLVLVDNTCRIPCR